MNEKMKITFLGATGTVTGSKYLLTTFIMHGEPLASDALRRRIEEAQSWACKVPDYLETCDLA